MATLARWWAAETQSRARIAMTTVCIGIALGLCGAPEAESVQTPSPQAQSAPPTQIDKDIAELVLKLEAAAASGDAKAYLGLIGPDANQANAENFATLQFRPGVTRAVLRERDRLPITDLPDGTGYVLVVDAFIQFGDRGSVSTWRLDVRRYDASDGGGGSSSGSGAKGGSVRWLVHGQDRLTSVEGLYRLHLNTKRQYRINNLRIGSEDLSMTIPTGFAYAADSDQGPTALVVVGQGEVTFSPKPAAEKGQIKLLAGEEALKSKIRSVFVRVNPYDLNAHFSDGGLVEDKVNPDALGTAQELFDEHVGKSFGLDLNDLSRETWSLVPPIGDFLSEITTARFGTLTYTQSNNESEDISLFDRRKRHNISAYASARKLAQRGRFYTDDEQVDFVVQHYDIQTNFSPDRNWLEGRTVLRLRVRSYVLGTLTLRLADSLAVHSVTSPRFGRLLSLRVKGQNSVLVNLPAPLSRGDEITLAVSYAGRLETATPEREVLALQEGQSIEQREIVIPPEKRTIYTNRSYWYPQSPVPTYATAQMRLTVPDGVSVVASGTPAQGNPVRLEGTGGAEPRRLYVFSATQPARYFAVILSRLSAPIMGTVRLDPEHTPSASNGNGNDQGLALVFYSQMDLGVLANPRQASRARSFLEQANTILSTYANIVRDVPYPSLTLTLVDDPLPGGHSPAYFTILHQPLPMGNYTWRNDPVSFDKYPQFFIAHELAHQFWGDAVGGENYHEQWISEGFAQYFALLYAERTRSRDTFEDILKQLRRTSITYDRNGPVWLGYRLGHLQGDSRIFRALVYNKGALVLHMLRRLIGDDAFFRGLRRFYQESRFKKVGTDDVMKAFEAESGQSLQRFFERWILEAGVPQVAVNYAIEDVDAKRAGPPMSQARTSNGISPSIGNSAIGTGTPQTPAPSTAGSAAGQSVLRVRFEQKGEVYDFPITVRMRYASGEIVDMVIPVTDRVIEQTLPLKGRLENVEINPDEAALVEVIRK
jgi:hypothetical protein